MLTGTSPAEQSPPFDRLPVHGFGPLRGALECEARAHEVASGAGDSSTKRTVTQHAVERPRPRHRVDGWHEQSRLPGGDEVGVAAGFGRDHREAQSHRLEQGLRQAFNPRRQGCERRQAVEGERPLRERDERHLVPSAEGVAQRQELAIGLDADARHRDGPAQRRQPGEEDVLVLAPRHHHHDGRPVVVVVARRKDQHVLLAGLPALRRPVAVACVGIEPDRELLALRDALRGRHKVAFVSFTERPLPFYRLAALAALPSRIEGLSQALLEAMALGLPVVASEAGGNPDLVTSGETGLLVPPVDPMAWARALDRVLGDGAFRARIARAGRDLVRSGFTLERTAERTEAVYGEAIERRRLLGGRRSR